MALPRSRAALAGVLMAAIALAGPPVASAAETIQVVPVSTQAWVGPMDLILGLYDLESVPITDPAASATLVLVAPDGSTREPVALALRRFVAAGRELFVARVVFDQVGQWRADVTVDDGGEALTGHASLTVRPDDGTPALGSAVPDVVTPTMRSASNLMRSITSDPDPIPDFYIWSVSELLAAGQPFVLVFDSYVFRPNEACGGALGMVHEIFPEFPRLNIVHAEPWQTSYASGTLTLEPPEGPAALTDAATAYGIHEPPWLFLVDSEGRLTAKFTGVVGSDELRAAMAALSDGLTD